MNKINKEGGANHVGRGFAWNKRNDAAAGNNAKKTVYCPYCGTPLDEDYRVCSSCGAKFNDEKVGPDNHELLNIVEYDENKNVIGGILGGTYWGWMHIDILWVDIKFRKKGIGSRLLKAAEEEARKRGCHSVHVDTMSWQAPEFYKKNGYKIISELNDIPKGNKKYHLIKELNISEIKSSLISENKLKRKTQ